MRATYQQKIIANHLQRTLGHLPSWPFKSPLEVEDELCRQGLSLTNGEFLVLELGSESVRCGKLDGLSALADFPSNSVVFSYHELERAFYEQHTDWIEL